MKSYAYKYYQLPIENPRKFRSLSGSFFGEIDSTKEFSVNLSEYNLVYQGQVKAESPTDALNSLFRIFNVEHPKDYKGHSMSVSDLVKIEDSYYSCEPMGWKKVTLEGGLRVIK